MGKMGIKMMEQWEKCMTNDMENQRLNRLNGRMEVTISENGRF